MGANEVGRVDTCQTQADTRTSVVADRTVAVIAKPRHESGKRAGGKPLNVFDDWWVKLDRKRDDKSYPRDFMYFDAAKGELVWLYALSEPLGEPCDYPIIDFPGGTYAACDW